MKNILSVLSLTLMMHGAVHASDCRPAPKDVAELVQIRPNWHTVRGALAEFDPCHKSVELSRPDAFSGTKREGKPPLVIIVHGGCSLGPGEKISLAHLTEKAMPLRSKTLTR